MEVILKEDVAKLGSRGDVVKVAEGFIGPQPVAQFLPTDNFPGTFQKDLQQFQGLLLNSYF